MITAGEWYVEDGRLTHPQTGDKSGGTGLRVQARFRGADSSFNVATINSYAGGNEDDARLLAAAPELLAAAKRHLATSPVFRSKPVGFEGSAARLEQDDAIATENALRAAIAKAEGRQ